MQFSINSDIGVELVGYKGVYGLKKLVLMLPENVPYSSKIVFEALKERVSYESLISLLCPTALTLVYNNAGGLIALVSDTVIRAVADTKKPTQKIHNLPFEVLTAVTAKRLFKKEGLVSEVQTCKDYTDFYKISYSGSYELPISICKRFNIWFKEDMGALYVFSKVGKVPETMPDL